MLMAGKRLSEYILKDSGAAKLLQQSLGFKQGTEKGVSIAHSFDHFAQ